MLWPSADMGEAKFFENTSETYLGQINRKPRAQNPFEIDAAPARKPILLRIGAGLYQASQFFHLFVRQLRASAGRFAIDQAAGARVIKTVHPIAQRLPIHATDARRLRAVLAVVDRRQSQQAPRLAGILYRRRQPAQCRCVKVLPKSDRRAQVYPRIRKCPGASES